MVLAWEYSEAGFGIIRTDLAGKKRWGIKHNATDLATDGTLSGTPTEPGTFNFTATVTDASGARASKDFTLTVAAGLTSLR